MRSKHHIIYLRRSKCQNYRENCNNNAITPIQNLSIHIILIYYQPAIEIFIRTASIFWSVCVDVGLVLCIYNWGEIILESTKSSIVPIPQKEYNCSSDYIITGMINNIFPSTQHHVNDYIELSILCANFS